MADFVQFNEGASAILQGAFKSATTVFFLLSTSTVDTLTASATLAGGVAEITGTGYTRKSQAAPADTAGAVAFALMTWNTSAATNWPAGVKSVIAATTSDNTGKACCAWNLVTGGASRDMSAANTTENVTPTYTL